MTKTKEPNLIDNIGEKKNPLHIVNFIFSLFVVCLPLVISFFHLLGAEFINYDILLIIFVLLYICYLAVFFAKNFTNINFKKLLKNPTHIILLVFVLWIILSSIITQSFGVCTLTYVSFFLIISSVATLPNKYKKILIDSFISVIVICCIMGFIDRNNEFMPGFISYCYPFSLQFHNPNHIGYVVVLAELLTVGLYLVSSNIYKKIFYAVSFIILGFYIFLNGSFGPITAIFLGLVIWFVYLWIQQKRFPFEILFIIMIMCLISVLVDNIPFLRSARFAEYGYFTECVAVFDNVFGTSFAKDWLGITSVPGADGWNRKNLWSQSLVYIGESFLFGKGVGFSNEFRPHNEFLYWSLDCGIIAGILYLALLVLLIIDYFKKKTKWKLISIISIISYYFSALFGNVTTHSFIYLMVVVGVFLNTSEENKNVENT